MSRGAGLTGMQIVVQRAAATLRMNAQLVLTLLDQALFSGANIAFMLVVAHLASRELFGRFSILYVFFVFTMGMSRALVSDPLMLKPRTAGIDARGMLSAATIVGLAGAAAMASLAAVPSWPKMLIAVFALTLPCLTLQDTYRARAYWRRDASHVLALDGTSVFIQFGLTTALLLVGRLDVVTATAAWGLGNVASIVHGSVRSATTPGAGAWTWLRGNIRTGGSIAGDFVSGAGAPQVVLLIVASAVGPAAVGALRIVQVALGPVNLLAAGLYGWAMPRIASSPGDRRRRLGATLGLALLGAAAVVGIVLLLLPTALLIRIFGAPWQGVTLVLLLLLTLDRMSLGLASALTWSARAQGRAPRMAAVRISLAIGLVAATLPLTVAYGVSGAAAAMAATSTVFCAIAWRNARARVS